MNGRQNILYLVHRVPYPPDRGDRIRSFHILKHLAERANVYLATLADEPVADKTHEALNLYCQKIAIEHVDRRRWLQAASSLAGGSSATEGLFRSAPLRRTIAQWSREVQFSAAVVFCSSMVQYLDVDELRDVPALVDLVDVDSQKFLDYANAAPFWKRWLYQLEGQRLRALEKAIASRAQAVTLVSEAEADLFRGFCPNDRTWAIANGVDLDYFSPRSGQSTPNRCVFVGALDYPPNIDAMQWFCREVWPRVRAALPDATLAIVGRNPAKGVRQLSPVAGVEVIGSVPDVRPHMAAASVAIAPLRIARGIQNKVLEAMAMGLPVIVSSGALEGLAAEPGKHLLLAQSAGDWAQSVIQVCRDRTLAGQLSRDGRSFVESAHSWSACLGQLDEALSLQAESPTGNSLATSAL